MRIVPASLFVWLASTLQAQPLVLAEKGQTSYAICVAAEASPSERRGAEELQRFLLEMSGARLPIAAASSCSGDRLILVGRSPATDSLNLNIPYDQLGDEGFVLKTSGTKLVIAGGRRRGTLYGVYTLLDKLGCRWFTSEVSRIPKREKLVLQPLDETGKPAFEYREPFFREAFERDWAARNRMNGASMKLDESTGGKITYYPFVHSFYEMIPPEKYFKEHPEYFSWIDGARRHERGQLCLTNPELLRVSVANVLRWIEEHPEAGIYSVSQNDWLGWCECENCRRAEQEEGGVHSGPLLRFVNAVAAEVEKKHPEKLIDTLAYWYTEEPPARERPRRNVRIRLCPIGACEAHPYEQCPRNAYFMKSLRAWSKITDRLYIWHYNTNFSHYLLPFPDFDELAADIPMYRRHGVMGLFMQGAYSEGGGGENGELRSYVMARMLWDPRADANQAVNEFLEGVYGRAAKPLRAYFDLLHRQVRRAPEGQGHHLYIFGHPGAPYLSEAFLERARRLFAEAESLADNDGVRRRVRKARLPIDYTDFVHAARFTFRGDTYAPGDAAGLERRFAELVRTARSFGITNFSEQRTIEHDEARLADRIRARRTVRLENARWLLDVVPDLDGRIVRMLDKASGRNALYEPDPGESAYPNQGGQVLQVFTDYHARTPMKVNWQVESAGGDAIVLAGSTDQGLRVTRRIAFTPDGAAIHTEAVARNDAAAEVEIAMQSRFEIGSGTLEGAEVTYTCVDGTPSVSRLMKPGEQPTGREEYRAGGLPRGDWRLSKPGAEWTADFPHVLLDRAYMDWSERQTTGVRLGIWSKKARLRTGETLRLEADYGMRIR